MFINNVMSKLQFFPYDINYKIEDNKVVIYLFSRASNGKRIIVLDDTFKPYFLVHIKKKRDTDKLMEKIEKLKLEDKEEYNVIETETTTRKEFGEEIDLIKVFVNIPDAVPIISKVISKWENVDSIYEADVPFLRRYLIDKGLTPITAWEAEGELINKKAKVDVFNAGKITQFSEDSIKEPRMLAFDIETYNPEGKVMQPEKYPIIMIGLYGDNFERVITWKKFNTKKKYIEFVNSEVELLEKFKETIDEYKPEALVGYFSDGFDFPYIGTRAKKYKLSLDIGLDFSKVDITRREISTSKIAGITHIDIFKFIRRVVSLTMKTDKYDLSSVANELIGEIKKDVELNNLAKDWDEGKNLEAYAKYNLQDSLLTYKLTKKLIPNIFELVKIVGMFPYNATRIGFSQLIEAYLLNQSKNFGEIIKNKPIHEEIRERRKLSFQGAFVYEPKAGIYEDIIVLDYRSLYPSIISSHNISPETLNCKCCDEKSEKAPEIKEKYWFCKKRKGFIPSIVDNLIKRRMRIKEMIANKGRSDPILTARSEGLKVLANSLYGYYGFFGARWYCIECSKSITAWGRHYIHSVINKAEENGFKVIYSDTDSVFLLMGKKTKKDIEKFTENINVKLPGLMELEYEGHYPRGIFVKSKGKDVGAKKKYALISDEGEIKITGFETVRRNWSPIAKKVQKEVIKIVLKENDSNKALKHVKKIIEELRKNKIKIEDVVMTTQLQKNIEEYVQIGPHVAVAKRMKAKGLNVSSGSMIKYVVVKGKGMIRDRARAIDDMKNEKYDSDYYINNQVVPAVEGILSVFGHEKDEIISDKTQSNLGKFL